jgi:hypothetical protein
VRITLRDGSGFDLGRRYDVGDVLFRSTIGNADDTGGHERRRGLNQSLL